MRKKRDLLLPKLISGELDISDLDIKIRKKDEIDDSVILASKKNGTLYIGITNDLVRRVYEHKT